MASETQILSREMAHAYLSGTTISNRLFSPAYQRIMTLIMQNEANLRNDKMNTTSLLTRDYENETGLRTPGKQTQSKPISVPLAPFIVYNCREIRKAKNAR